MTSSSSFGRTISPADADTISAQLVAANPELQWSEGSYRGFFVLSVGADALNATYYALRDIRQRMRTHLPALTLLFCLARTGCIVRLLGGRSTPAC